MEDELEGAVGRDAAGAQRDVEAQSRDDISEHDDTAAETRDRAADRRDVGGADRDTSATERDKSAGWRDDFADRRDRSAELRDSAADARDVRKDKPRIPGSFSSGDTQSADPTPVAGYERELLEAKGAAASDRGHASADRAAASWERASARSDREAAGRDRGFGLAERSLSQDDRHSASLDRESGASGRAHADSDRADARADRGSATRDRYTALFDELTGAYTRGAGFVELDREIARSRRRNEPLVVAFIDIDHFKHINDTHGHLAGDKVLIRLTETLRATLRVYDVVARYGGDEFFAILAGLDLTVAGQRFERIDLTLSSTPPTVSISVGLAQLQAADTASDLVARADAAMYRTRGRPPIRS